MIEELKKEGLFLTNGNFNPSYVKKFNNSITPERKAWYDSCLGDTLSEKIYIFLNNLTQKPVCKQCGSPVKFISFGEGYREYCGSSCKNIALKDVVAETNIKKYGTKAPAQSKAIQDKMKATTKERYGVENIFQRTDIIKEALFAKRGVYHPMELPECRDRLKKTSQEKYGVDHPLKSSVIRKRISDTNLEKYGNICSCQEKGIATSRNENNKTKAWERHQSLEKYSGKVKFLPTRDEYKGTVDENGQAIYYKWQCLECNQVFEEYISSKKLPRCSNCYPPGLQGTMEKELVDWIKSVVPTTTLVLNSRRIVSPLEIDIYLPEYNLAIEFDEIYWHCELTSGGKRNHQYHLSKTEKCKEQGIDLIHVLDSEWWEKPEIVKSIISAKLGIFVKKIGARKCTIQQLSSAESEDFLNNNHIQGYAPAQYKYGLIYNGELVAHLAISKNRFKEGTYEIVRYASKIGYTVQGGLSKLWKEIKKSLPQNFTLISYVDLRYFHGESNTSIGLTYSHSNRPAYHYTIDFKTLENRMNFQKKNMVAKGLEYDEELTEWENMKLNGYDRIWDCGTKVYKLEESNNGR